MDELPIYLFHRGTNYEAYKLFCPRQVHEKGADGWVFHCWAPGAKAVSVVGDFNGWNERSNPMKKISVGVWRAFVPHAEQWQNYRFSIKGKDGVRRLKSDPYAVHACTMPDNASKLFRLDGYPWQDGHYMSRRHKEDVFNSPLNIYEIHLGSWRRYPAGENFGYRQLADELVPYLTEMHYTHVEFMPVTEYPFEPSWGYQCTGMFAPTSRYGTPHDFMYLVDRLHSVGIGVIIDWVPAHFPKDGFGLYRFDGGFLYEYGDAERREHPQWGTVVYDYGRNEVRSFLISSAMYWLDYYHVDGIRMDAVSSMLYLDFGREAGHWTPNVNGGNINLEAENFLKELNNAVHTYHPDVLMIAEESSSFPKITTDPRYGGLGFDFKWNMGWMNDTLRYIGTDPFFRKDCHNLMTFGMMYAFNEHYLLALSHDEVVHCKGSLISRQQGYPADKFGGLMAYLGFQMAHPGKKLTFMGADVGQFEEWDYKGQIRWDLLQYAPHRGLNNYVKDLNKLYLDTPALWEVDCSYDGFRWLVVNDAGYNIYAWARMARNGDMLVCVFNFSPMARNDYWVGVPRGGAYTAVLASHDGKYIEGGPAVEGTKYKVETGQCGEFDQYIRINIAPNSALFIKNKVPKRRMHNEPKE